MPRATATDTQEPVKTDERISISKSELDALVKASVQAAVDSATSKSAGTTDFAEAMRLVLAESTSNQKKVIDAVLEKTGRTSNDMQSFPNISVFNPRGERDFPRPKLVDSKGKPRTTFFCGCLMNNLVDVMTVGEIEAFNAIKTDCDAHGGAWTATIRKNGTTEELHVALPMGDNDSTRHLPSQEAILFELLRGEKMPDVNSIVAKMVAKSADPKAFIANLEKLLAQVGETGVVPE